METEFMFYLDYSGIKIALDLCNHYKHYRVLILVKDTEQVTATAAIIEYYATMLSGIQMHYLTDGFTIDFSNGSEMLIYPFDKLPPVTSCNLLMADKEIDTGVIENVMKSHHAQYEQYKIY